jgi:hypothetical protein
MLILRRTFEAGNVITKVYILFSKSDFGSSFLIPQNIVNAKDNKHHFRLKRQRMNWNPEDMLYGLHLIAMSLNNIISCLKVLNGTNPENIQFQSPQEKETFKEPGDDFREQYLVAWQDPNILLGRAISKNSQEAKSFRYVKKEIFKEAYTKRKAHKHLEVTISSMTS